MSRPLVFIDGDQGTTGLAIDARLAHRHDIERLSLTAQRRKDLRWRADALNSCDIAILCLPDAAAREAVALVTNPAVRIIDASSAHRIQPDWTYGFAEMLPGQAGRIAAARRVTNPGCYPTGAIALLRPLVEAGLLAADCPLAVHAVSGYSGRGRAGVEQFETTAGAAAPAFQVYGLSLDHKHVPEIQHHAGLAARPVFVPAYGAFRQGIVLTVALHRTALAGGIDGATLRRCLAERYRDAAQVQVLDAAQSAALDTLDPTALNGSDGLRLAVFDNPVHGQVLLAAVFDNLGKGAAGAAVQNLDLMLGRPPS